jgi:hypothetical protein
MRDKRYFLIFLSVFACILTKAQVKDAALWTTIDVEKAFTQKFSAYITEELRFNENITELGTFFTELGVSYKIQPEIGFSAGYRYINKRNLDDSYTARHRFHLAMDYKFDIKSFTVGLKGKFQSQFSDELFTTTDQLIPGNYARGKISVKYNLEKRYKPFVSTELFYQLNNPEGNEIDNIRYVGGIDYELNKISSFKLYYMLQKEMHVKNPRTDYVTGLEYDLRF